MNNWKRQCPSCEQEISYSKAQSFRAARRRNSTCESCRRSNLGGHGNPFHGKSHTDEARAKMRDADHSYKKSDAFKAAVKNGMVGKTCGGDVRRLWEKLPPEEAAKRRESWIAKKRESFAGDRNPMYGRPSPQGSGNGWSGWYKGWYFRSLRELAYVVKFLEPGEQKWSSAESAEFRVDYTDPLGKQRTYHPDFVVGERLLVECKPKRLWNTPSVQAKAKAAKVVAAKLGLEYILVDPERLTNEEIQQLHDSGEIQFLEKYERLYNERFSKAG